MWTFLRRVLGTSPEYEAAKKRYDEARRELESRGKDLDDLLESLKETSVSHLECREAISKTRTDFTDTLTRTISTEMEAITEEELEEFEARQRREKERNVPEETPPEGTSIPAGS